MAGIPLPRHPLAFGITYWGPLPGTGAMHVQWDGPGTGLYLYASDPTTAAVPGMRIRHHSASGTYGTVRTAESAVRAFLASVEVTS
jgi:hypothetical protein